VVYEYAEFGIYTLAEWLKNITPEPVVIQRLYWTSNTSICPSYQQQTVIYHLLWRRQCWIWCFRNNLSNYPCRITSNDMKRRNVLCHNRACADSHASSNSDSWQYDDTPPKPAILANRDRFSQLWTLSAVTEERIQWVGGRVEGASRSNESACTDGNKARIKKGTIEVDVDTFT
jgi:hypothetical protein